jgi:hypothetical protein
MTVSSPLSTLLSSPLSPTLHSPLASPRRSTARSGAPAPAGVPLARVRLRDLQRLDGDLQRHVGGRSRSSVFQRAAPWVPRRCVLRGCAGLRGRTRSGSPDTCRRLRASTQRVCAVLRDSRSFSFRGSVEPWEIDGQVAQARARHGATAREAPSPRVNTVRPASSASRAHHPWCCYSWEKHVEADGNQAPHRRRARSHRQAPR